MKPNFITIKEKYGLGFISSFKLALDKKVTDDQMVLKELLKPQFLVNSSIQNALPDLISLVRETITQEVYDIDVSLYKQKVLILTIDDNNKSVIINEKNIPDDNGIVFILLKIPTGVTLKYNSIHNSASSIVRTIMVDDSSTVQCDMHNNCDDSLSQTTIQLKGDNSNAAINHGGIVTGQSTIVHNICHRGKETTSSIKSNIVVSDNGVLHYRPKIYIKNSAINAQANQTVGILKSMQGIAKINTIPQLEIKRNKVVCTHGASIQPINKQSLQYLQTKGISANVAKDILINAHANRYIQERI